MTTTTNKYQPYLLYVAGFCLSLVLTIGSFGAVYLQRDSGGLAYSELTLVIGLAVFAITQMIVQLLFFFHLGDEKKPRLNLASFLFMLMVVGIIAFGSIWIMYSLNYNMMPHEVDTYIQQEEQIYKTDEHHQH